MPKEVKPKKKQFSLSLMVRVFLTVMVVVSIVVFVSGVMKFNELRQKQQELEESKAILVEEKEELQELLDSENSESYIIRMARKFWGLFFPDEEVIFNDRNS